MGLFSKIRESFSLKSNSRIRNYSKKIKREIKTDPKATLEDHLFCIFLDGVSRWWDDNIELDVAKSEVFDGDMPIFEVGCYVIFRIDLWFYINNHPDEVRKKIMGKIVTSFIEVFENETELSNAGTVFDNRQRSYFDNLREGEELPINSFLFDLEQLILRTKNDKRPEVVDVKKLPIDLDFGSAMLVKLNVRAYEKYLIPAFFTTLGSAL